MSTTIVREVAGVPIYVDTETGRFSATIPGAGKWGRDRTVERSSLRDVAREVEKARVWEGVDVVTESYALRALRRGRVLRGEKRGYRRQWSFADGTDQGGVVYLYDAEKVARADALAEEINLLTAERNTVLASMETLTLERLAELRAAAVVAADGHAEGGAP